MKITGYGVDIEEIGRFKKLEYDKYKKFYEKVFTQAEIAYCLSKTYKYSHFAVRYCAKEAFIKAVDYKISLREVEVVMKRNKPCLLIFGRKTQSFVSLSHTKQFAFASVVVVDTLK